MVSVILTSYNHGKYICESIDSVLNQTFVDFELIILDDCSTDSSWELISQYTDSRIKAFRSGRPGDVAFSFNNAITNLAHGKYIAIHHSDDIWSLDKLERQITYLDAHPEIGAVFSNAQAISENGTELLNDSHFYSNVFDQKNRSRHEWLRYFFTHGNALCHPSILIRKVCYEECGLPRYGMTQLADLDMWVRLCLKYEIHILPEKLVQFRVRDGEANMSANRAIYRIRAFYEYYKLLQNYRKITNFDELVMVFPAAKKYDRNSESDQDFALAMVSLDEGKFSFVKIFALDLLFEIISDPNRAAKLKLNYGFDHLDFYSLTSSHDVFAREIIADHERTIADHERTIADHEKTIADHEKTIAENERVLSVVYDSTSWRLTRPLRLSVNILRKLIRVLYSMPRRIYMRIGFLRTLRRICLQFKLSVTKKIHGLVNSSENRFALQALSARRFDHRAAHSGMGVTQITEWPEIDVSVVTFNSNKWVSQFIKSLLVQHYPLKKIHLRFIDHGSQDNTLIQLENSLTVSGARFASAQIIQQPNMGFGAGHDRAIREGKSPYCLVTNIDLEFAPDSLCNVVRAGLADTESAVASWEFRQIPYEHPKYYDPVTLETNWSSHACILIRRDAYKKVGGYDPQIFMYAEDVEISYRFRSFGYILKYVPQAVVNHFTYENAGQVKPLQFTGSILGNCFIRFRYGKFSDKIVAFLIYFARFFARSPFPDAKLRLLKNVPQLIGKIPHFLSGKGSGAYFPLRGFDYEMTREGAFWAVQPLSSFVRTPLVTVITRTYCGREMFLKQAIQSVLNQTYPAIELLVVEDGGATQRPVVESCFEHTPPGFSIRFIENGKFGRSAAGNQGLASAKGEFIMFLDDDDLLFSDHVEILVSTLMRNESLSAAYALAFEVYTKLDQEQLTYVEKLFTTPEIFHQEWNYDVLLDHNFISIQAILFKKQLYEERGGFDTELDQLEDWNLWLRYGCRNHFAYVPKTTSLFRSPADLEVRSTRQELLHNAYGNAKSRAIEACAKLSYIN
jgi:glycosyltransferase involved in cell wall biosynthesis